MKKTVLITGGAVGIGAAAARAFYDAGYSVAINYNSSEKEAFALSKELGGAYIYKADVSDEAAVSAMVSDVCGAYGTIDVLINNAGICKTDFVDAMPLSQWEQVFAVNVRGTFLCTKHTVPIMIRKKSGCIINISSIWGISGAAMESCYSASKGAVTAFTKACAKELGPSNIRVNAIAPGFIDTKMNSAVNEAARAAFCEETPLGRIGTPKEAASLALYLASSEAAFITGQVIACDGGYTI